MRRTILSFAALGSLALATVALASQPGTAPAPPAASSPVTPWAAPAAAVQMSFLAQEGRCDARPGMSRSLASPSPRWLIFDPGGCGNCGITCRSDSGCLNRQPGDVCNNTGGTCQIYNACDLTNCCRCQ